MESHGIRKGTMTSLLLAAMIGCGQSPQPGDAAAADEWMGPPQRMGEGAVWIEGRVGADGIPAELAVVLSEAALAGLPAESNTTSRCFDGNGDGALTKHECLGDYELRLELPAGLAGNEAMPFRWIMVNWNAEGHVPPPPKAGDPAPPAPYVEPHFDFHFYMTDASAVDAIRPGPCGEMVNCDDFETGRRPVPAEYLPEDYIDVGAVAAAMGNHLLDARSPELANPPARFTRTFIFGTYDGEVMFWEPMITRSFIQGTDSACFDIRRPARYARPGAYPSRYCVRHDTASGQYRIALEDFVQVTGEKLTLR